MVVVPGENPNTNPGTHWPSITWQRQTEKTTTEKEISVHLTCMSSNAGD